MVINEKLYALEVNINPTVLCKDYIDSIFRKYLVEFVNNMIMFLIVNSNKNHTTIGDGYNSSIYSFINSS